MEKLNNNKEEERKCFVNLCKTITNVEKVKWYKKINYGFLKKLKFDRMLCFFLWINEEESLIIFYINTSILFVCLFNNIEIHF